MKNTIRFISLILAVCAITLSFASCLSTEPKEKDFSKAGLTITLTEEFTEQEIVTQTAYYLSQKAIVTTLKESDEVLKDFNVKKYAEAICEIYKLDSTVTVQEGYAEFSYEKELSGKDYHYYARCYKNGNDFWLVQFACETKNIEEFKPKFDKWASSIKFDQ